MRVEIEGQSDMVTDSNIAVAVSMLRLQPGDVLVVTLSTNASAREVDRVKAALEDALNTTLSFRVPVIVLAHGATLERVGSEQLSQAGLSRRAAPLTDADLARMGCERMPQAYSGYSVAGDTPAAAGDPVESDAFIQEG